MIRGSIQRHTRKEIANAAHRVLTNPKYLIEKAGPISKTMNRLNFSTDIHTLKIPFWLETAF